jgi:hypothetical protein
MPWSTAVVHVAGIAGVVALGWHGVLSSEVCAIAFLGLLGIHAPQLQRRA